MPGLRRLVLPADVYSLVERTPGTILFEGGQQKSGTEEGPREAAWTRLFTAPSRICVAFQLSELPSLFAEIERAVAAGLTAAGYFTYECGMAFEPKAAMRPSRTGSPLAWFGIYDRAHIFDHEAGAFIGGAPAGLANTTSQASQVSVELQAEFALTESDYAQRISAIHEWIRSGDIYQLNFTAPLRFSASDEPAALYARLRARQPARYGAFLHTQQDQRILSFSPELFFRIDSEGATRRITTRPMKGTAARGHTTSEDRAIADWLRNDQKNRSENLMIVDLLRNDLGRIARFGSVRAENLFSVERLSTLWQMTSTVTAELRGDVRFEDVFRALFPCGSVTGAPKVRAMQLIAELEDGPRGIYTGAIGFFSPQQTVFNVAIRTIELDGDRATMGIGSGIVIDSVADAEYRECLLKAEFLTRSAEQRPQQFALIETMLWNDGFPLIELHLDRLCDSADYFDLTCDRVSINTALEHHAHKFSSKEPRRVRLLLCTDGSLSITHELLVVPSEPRGTSRVCIARERTDATDPMLYHKTTHRPLYGSAFDAAAKEGYADVLFFNTRGELTEGAISNVFIEKDGRWFTPPVECGLLAGVYRRHLLETQPHIEQRVLREEDLRTADAVYIANAMRGLRKVAIDWE